MSIIRTGCILSIAASLILSGCSESSAPAPLPEVHASTEDLLKLYDPSSLVEVKILGAFPVDLQSVLGVHATGYSRIADMGEPCSPRDVADKNPGRCFLVGGVSNTGALVAFRNGGYTGGSTVAEVYVDINSTWTKIESWELGPAGFGYPGTLTQLMETIRLAGADRSLRAR